MSAVMDGVHVLLLCCLWASTFSLFAVARNIPGDTVGEDEDDVVETTFHRLCKGVEEELTTCNQRLIEKSEYSRNIEKDLFALKRQLREMRINCRDSAHAATVQISALQSQLNSLLQKLGENATGPAKDVLNILQQYVYMKKLEMNLTTETDPAKIAELDKLVNIARRELENMKINNNNQATCQIPNSSQIEGINALQKEIDKLKRGGGSAADSQRITELQKQLDQKLRELEQSGDAGSKQVAQILELQDQISALQKRLAELLKTQAERDALQKRLEDKLNLLSNLKEESDEKGPNTVTDKQISELEREVGGLEDDLARLNLSLAKREELEKELDAKNKQMEDKLSQMKKDEQSSTAQILALQFELQQVQDRAHGEKMAAEFTIADLKKQLSEKSEKFSFLLARNQYLQEKLSNTLAECDDLQQEYNQISEEVEKVIEKLPEASLKYVLEIVSINTDIDNIQNRIKRETSQEKITELQKELKQKTDELSSKKAELKKKEPSADKSAASIVLEIIKKMETIWKMQNEVVDVDSLDQISALHQELLKLIRQLDDTNPSKLVLRNMAMLSDIGWMKKLIKSVSDQTQAEISVLQEELEQKQKKLEQKEEELAKMGSEIEKLGKEILALKEEEKKLKSKITDLEKAQETQVKDLQNKLDRAEQELEKVKKALGEKDKELAQKVDKITELLEKLRLTKEEAERKETETAALISNLQDELKTTKEENSKLDEDNKRLQQELEEAKECAALQKSYQELQEEFHSTVSQLNNSLAGQVLKIQTLSNEVANLEKQLSNAQGNINELTDELKKKKAALEKATNDLKKARADSAELLKLLETMRKVSQDQDQTISEYLAEITRLEEDLEALMAKQDSTGQENAKLTIQVIFLKEELAKMQKMHNNYKQQSTETIKRLEKEIEEKNKQINFLKSSGCGADQLKKKIAQLEREKREAERNLQQLKKSSTAEIDKLEKKIAERNKKLDQSAEKLKEKDAKNAALIERLVDLGEQLKAATSEKQTITQKLQQQISNLEKQVKDKEKDISALQDNNAVLKRGVEQKEEELVKVKQQVKDKEHTITNLQEQLEEKEEKECKAVASENTRLRAELAAKEARIRELEKAPSKQDCGEEESTHIALVSPEFDLATAHRRLLITNGGKVLTTSPFSRVVPDSPQRYDTALAVLGKQGYISGRHYWEVDVGNRGCFIVGVAKASATRKGELTYDPEHGYWGLLRRNDGKYQVLSTPRPTLRIRGTLRVIGMLVDFVKSQVSIYNAKDKVLLYTYPQDNFNEKMYPFVETCAEYNKEDSPIILSEAGSVLWLEKN